MAIQTPILLYITTKNKQEALRIAEMLLEERLIACANILTGMTSVFRWKGSIRTEREILLLAKTTETVQDAAILRAGQLHGYDCPAIIALPVSAAHTAFAHWIDGEINNTELQKFRNKD
jgi:periplasmic divalent cation tolerance protein